MSGAQITEPGVYNISDEDYHADPVPGGSLSSTGARKLLPPSCPALFRYQQDNPPAPSHVFDIGHAAHTLVLGTGPEFAVIEADDWRTKAAKEARKAAHEAGKTPLLVAEHDQVHAMAAAILEHPIARALLDPELGGQAEQTLIWEDGELPVMRRAKLDWLPHPFPHGRLLAVDYKTTQNASPESIRKSVANYGYHQQAAWYLDGLTALNIGGWDPAFLFIFQEKQPPYLVTVVEPDRDAIDQGRYLNRQAINTYARCTTTGHWPGYSEDVELISLPAWAQTRLQEIA